MASSVAPSDCDSSGVDDVQETRNDCGAKRARVPTAADSSQGAKRYKPHRRESNVNPEVTSQDRTRPRKSLSYDDYTVAWICALHLEMAAARAVLDEVHEDLPINQEDSNHYIVGSIQRHNVVIACLPTDQYGIVNADSVASDLKWTFKSICFTFMVGIGGGAPSMADLRLGDVVVGIRIMQSDFGRNTEQNFQRTVSSSVPPKNLSTLIPKVRAKHETEGPRLPRIMRRKFRRLPEFGYPDLDDRLFQATYEHESTTPGCDTCDYRKWVHRNQRESNNPVIHYKPIALTSQVMRSATHRDRVARELGVVCFSMDAANIADTFPCLVIRGISDYSDSHKDNRWRKYAAAAAASCARELLEECREESVNSLPSFAVRGVSDYSDSHMDKHWQDYAAAAAASSTQNLREECREASADTCPANPTDLAMTWPTIEVLKFTGMQSREQNIEKAHPQTCEWLFEHPEYRDWLKKRLVSHRHSFLWIYGKLGAGKSTIMKYAYSDLRGKRKSQSATIAFFFNAQGETLERSVEGMYRSLLYQVLQSFRDLSMEVGEPKHLSSEQCKALSLGTLEQMFRGTVLSLGKRSLTCFIDALDEGESQGVIEMIHYFENLAEEAYSTRIDFRVCFSSRPYSYLIRDSRYITFYLQDLPQHRQDMERYVEDKLRVGEPEPSKSMRHKLLEKAEGVFLWVVISVQILNQEYGTGRMAPETRLAELPSGLSELLSMPGIQPITLGVQTVLEKEGLTVSLANQPKDLERDSGYASASRLGTLTVYSRPANQEEMPPHPASNYYATKNSPNDIGSLASDDDEIDSRASIASTPTEMNGKALIAMFLAEEPQFREICKKAMARTEKQRFIETMRKLLKTFYKRLVQEAETEAQKAVARLLRSRQGRRRISWQLATHLQEEEEEAQEELRVDHEPSLEGKIGIESWLAGVSDTKLGRDHGRTLAFDTDKESLTSSSDDDFPYISDLRAFLCKSKSFQLLQTDLILVCLPADIRHVLLSIPKHSIWISQKQETSLMNKFKSWVEDRSQVPWNWWPLEPRKVILQDGESRMFWRCVIMPVIILMAVLLTSGRPVGHDDGKKYLPSNMNL